MSDIFVSIPTISSSSNSLLADDQKWRSFYGLTTQLLFFGLFFLFFSLLIFGFFHLLFFLLHLLLLALIMSQYLFSLPAFLLCEGDGVGVFG